MNFLIFILLFIFCFSNCLKPRKSIFDFNSPSLSGFGFIFANLRSNNQATNPTQPQNPSQPQNPNSDPNNSCSTGCSMNISGLTTGTISLNVGGQNFTINPSNSSITISTTDSQVNLEVNTHPDGFLCSLSPTTASISRTSTPTIQISCSVFAVNPVYQNNGRNWNDYVTNDGTDWISATDSSCNSSIDGGYNRCIHGGQYRQVVLTGINSCAGLFLSESLSAFNWRCVVVNGNARFYSYSLKEDKGVTDLVNFTTPAWLQNQITITKNGQAFAKTNPASWWTNPVVAGPVGGGTFSTLGQIVLLNLSSYSGTFTMSADKLSLVGPKNSFVNFTANCHNTSLNFNWVEGNFNFGNATFCLTGAPKYSVYRNIKIRTVSSGSEISSFTGIGTSNNYFSNWTTSGANKDFAALNFSCNNCKNNLARKIYDSNSSITTGFDISVSGGSKVRDFIILDSVASGALPAKLSVSGTGSELTNFFLSNFTIGNSFLKVDALSSGITNYTTFNSIISANAGAGNNYSSTGSNMTFRDTIFAHGSTSFNIVAGSLNNFFTGNLKVGPIAFPCTINASFGLATSTCANQGTSNASLTTGTSVSNSFVGPVTVDDSVNSSDSNGSLVLNSINDWTNFENPFRAWGKDGSGFSGFGNGSIHSGACTTGTCTIWDWSLRSTDTVARAVLPVPTGSDVGYHYWSPTTAPTCANIKGAVFGSICNRPNANPVNAATCTAAGGAMNNFCYTVYLRNALEIMEDGIGNENGICESNEDCIYTPNIGAYQGHGALTQFQTITSGTLNQINLYRYAVNGR